jgi:hypothetical protein
MANQRSLPELIDKAENKHKDIFDKPLYSYRKIKYPYQNNGVWEIECIQHSKTFFQDFRKHLSGQTGCKECVAEKKSKNTIKERADTFIKKAQSIHIKDDGSPLYDYSEVRYISSNKKVIIVCREHGNFPMTPGNHTHKTLPQGCPKCGGKFKRTKEEFVREAQKLHSDSKGNPLYDYSKIEYVDAGTHISIFCKKHNINFRQTPSKHLLGQKCRKCSKEIVANKISLSREEFIIASEKVHRDSKGNSKYDYSEVVYKNNHTKVKIICPHHGVFEQTPSVHKDAGSGCKHCRASKGEQMIAAFLIENNITFETEYKFDDCLFIKPLPFDFMVERNGEKILIEYNGEIHYKPGKWSKNTEKAMEQLRNIEKRDRIKQEYARKNRIPLFIFDYKQKFDEISKILKTTLGLNN